MHKVTVARAVVSKATMPVNNAIQIVVYLAGVYARYANICRRAAHVLAIGRATNTRVVFRRTVSRENHNRSPKVFPQMLQDSQQLDGNQHVVGAALASKFTNTEGWRKQFCTILPHRHDQHALFVDVHRCASEPLPESRANRPTIITVIPMIGSNHSCGTTIPKAERIPARPPMTADSVVRRLRIVTP